MLQIHTTKLDHKIKYYILDRLDFDMVCCIVVVLEEIKPDNDEQIKI